MGQTKCNVNFSDECRECKNRVCGKIPIIKSILSSEDVGKKTSLIKVLDKFEIKIQMYL